MIIMNTMEYKQQLLKLLSLEYNCDPDAFAGEDNILTESKLCDGRRMYGNKKYFFHMVTLGSNAVIMHTCQAVDKAVQGCKSNRRVLWPDGLNINKAYCHCPQNK